MWQLEERKRPIYRQIVQLILTYIEKGRLVPGESLPAERELAERLQVNRSTIVHALDELVAMGVIVRRQGSGTRVNDQKWGQYQEGSPSWHHYLKRRQTISREERLHRFVQEKIQLKKIKVDAYTGELRDDLIPAVSLPTFSWQRYLVEEKQQDEWGYFPLRTAIAEYMRESTAQATVGAEEILVTSGAQQALFFIVHTLLEPGDAVLIEEPSFLYALSLFQSAGVRVYGVPMDESGMQTSHLEELILKTKAKIVFMQPTFQNPTGTTLSLQRRQECLRICQKHQLLVVEDDAFSYLPYPEKEQLVPPSLKALAPDHVLYIGSLSKLFGSMTKVGWIAGPPAILAELGRARSELDSSLSIFPQVFTQVALQAPELRQTIQQIQKVVASNVDYLCQKLQELGGHVLQPLGGFYVYWALPGKQKANSFVEQLAAKGVAVSSMHYYGSRAEAIRINVAHLERSEMDIFLSILGEIL